MRGDGRAVGAASDGARADGDVLPEFGRAMRRGHVLVVDDEPMIAQALRRLLLPEHDVETPDTPTQALAMLEGGARFDVIVLDVTMPRLSGPEFYGRLAQVDPAQASRVVFLSGGATEPQTIAFLASVDNPKLDKPIPLDELRDVINGFVERGLRRPA